MFGDIHVVTIEFMNMWLNSYGDLIYFALWIERPRGPHIQMELSNPWGYPKSSNMILLVLKLMVTWESLALG
jgi:hypothetical protein